MAAPSIALRAAARPRLLVARDAVRAAVLLSWLLVVDATATCLLTLLRPELVHGPAVAVGNLRGTALVLLVVALPVLVVGISAALRGSLVGLVGWVGARSYAAYQGYMFLLAVPFNGLFLFNVGILAFAGWALIALVPRLPLDAFAEAATDRMPVRALGAYLVAMAVAFYLLWGKAIVPALFASEHPAFLEGTGMTTGPGQILDLAFSLPTTILAGVLLWRRRPWGYALGGAILVFGTIESVSIGVDQWFGSAADPTSSVSSAALLPVFAVVALVGLACVVAYARGLRAGPAASG